MSDIPSSESRMVDCAKTHLGESAVQFATEVPFMGRSIDLVYVDRDGELVTVEFKRRDWRRALKQARDHALGSSRVYICLPASRITDSARREAQEMGIGVFSWTEGKPLAEEISPSIEKTQWSISRQWLKERFQFRLSGQAK